MPPKYVMFRTGTKSQGGLLSSKSISVNKGPGQFLKGTKKHLGKKLSNTSSKYFTLLLSLGRTLESGVHQSIPGRQNTIHAHTDTFGQFKVSNQPTPPMSMFSGTLKKTRGEHVKQMLFCDPPQITPPTRSGPEASGLTHLHSIITFAV